MYQDNGYSVTKELMNKLVGLCHRHFGKEATVLCKLNFHYARRDAMVLIYHLPRIYGRDDEHTVHCQINWMDWEYHHRGIEGSQKWFTKRDLKTNKELMDFIFPIYQYLEDTEKKVLNEMLEKVYSNIEDILGINKRKTNV